jgi:O-antigen chain-terminating methyltransferase
VTLYEVVAGVSPDYAVVAQKKAETPEQSNLFDKVFDRVYGIDLETLATRYHEGVSAKLSEILSRVDRSAEFEARATAAQTLLTQTQQQLAQAQEKLAARNLELLQTTERIGALLSSRSWRLTKPLRVISRWLAKGLKYTNLDHR